MGVGAVTAVAEDAPAPRVPVHLAGGDDDGFIPGTLLAGRYRLVALLGRGGMGKVYRAEDMRLGQTVALKFLPDALARDREMLERFYAEVRIGRQVSHPNVCRLHDLIEIDGHHCLSMEYVDGEDLSVLLARIGRLPPDKAIEIARDLCAGLAAAHDMGVIHRDLKPANVMIDGKGRARIADFGIAALADRVDGESVAGTPAYMAPELVAGQSASVRSDIYALGLILYEVCTGQRRFQASTLDALRAQQLLAEPPNLSNSVRDIPIALERLIQQCLARDPQARPASVHALMAALPGGDPLQAALAAGETPTPAMVAAAGKVGALGVGSAWMLMLGAFAGLFALAWISGSSTLVGRLQPPKSPELLADKASEILAEIGSAGVAGDRAVSFIADDGFLAWIQGPQAHALGADEMQRARPGPLKFIYRQSPGELVARRTLVRPFGPADVGRVTYDDPPTTLAGMADVVLDRDGLLLGLRVVGRTGKEGAVESAPDWSLLLKAAGFVPDQATPTTPRLPVPVDSDLKRAWTAFYPDQPGIPMHVEAAALQGMPVWFGVLAPWNPAESMPLSPPGPLSAQLPVGIHIAIWTLLVINAIFMLAIAVLVRRNLRQGRADLQGARRLATVLFACALVAQLLRADHVALVLEEANLLINVLGQVVLYVSVAWLTYVALEPVARRRWPELLVGWSRLLAGRWNDPLVGRDVTIGIIGGIVMALAVNLESGLPALLGLAGSAPRVTILSSLAEFRHWLYFLLSSPYVGVAIGFGTLLAMLIFQSMLRRRAVALPVLAVALYFGFATVTGIGYLWSAGGAAFTLIYLVIALRAGLLAAVVSIFCFLVLDATALTLDWSVWYANRTIAALCVIGVLLMYGFKCALAGKPMLGGLLVDRDV